VKEAGMGRAWNGHAPRRPRQKRAATIRVVRIRRETKPRRRCPQQVEASSRFETRAEWKRGSGGKANEDSTRDGAHSQNAERSSRRKRLETGVARTQEGRRNPRSIRKHGGGRTGHHGCTEVRDEPSRNVTRISPGQTQDVLQRPPRCFGWDAT